MTVKTADLVQGTHSRDLSAPPPSPTPHPTTRKPRVAGTPAGSVVVIHEMTALFMLTSYMRRSTFSC